MQIEYGLFKIPQGVRQHTEDKWATVLQNFMEQSQPMARLTFTEADGINAMAAIRTAYSALTQLLKRRGLDKRIYCKIRDNVIYLVRKKQVEQ